MEPRTLSIEDVTLGMTVSFTRLISEEDVETFAHLSGDANPLHMDELYAARTQFKHRIVHGMLLASLCSRLVGMYLPGTRCLYLGQTLEFRNPVFIGDTVTVVGTVTQVSQATKIVRIAITMNVHDTVVLNGEATTQILS